VHEVNHLIVQYQKTFCENCFNEIYLLYANKVFNYSKKQAFQRGLDVQEVTSEANLVIFKAITTFDHSLGEFEPYLFLMLRFTIANLGSRARTYQLYLNRYAQNARFATDNEPEIYAIKKEQRQLLNELLSNAPPTSRQALEAFATCYSFRAAAKQLGTSDKTVKNRIRKLIAGRKLSLRDYLLASNE